MFRDLIALIRSLIIYRFRPGHQASLKQLYRPFVKTGDLTFDVGAHAGDRTACLRKLGARVVSIEPQTLFTYFLRATNAAYPQVTVLACVLSNTAGTQTLHINSRNPTVSTVSGGFVEAATKAATKANTKANTNGAGGWQGQTWDRKLEVQATTLDDLITQYGKPAFIKIDVEGAEHDVLLGLSEAVPALSFEFTMIQRALTNDCIDRCVTLGFTAFNYSLGESHELNEPWLAANELKTRLAALPDQANSGDIYARCPA